jgi:CHAT domain-containing protein
MLFRCFLLATSLALTGCASMQPVEFQHLQQSRYAELRDVMEQKVPVVTQGKTADLVYLCLAYSRIRQYDRLFPCVEQMEANIRKGDKQLFVWDFSATPPLLRAVAAMEFADYPLAIAQAEVAVGLTEPKDSYQQLRIYALSAAGLAHALAGNRDQATAFHGKLEATTARGMEVSDKYLGLARIDMALGNYARAYDFLRREEEETAFFKGITNLVTGSALTGESIFTYWELPVRFMKNHALLQLGKNAEAKAGYDALLKEAGAMQSADLYWLLLFDRGRIAETEGDLVTAVALYRRSIEEIELQRASIKAEGAKIGFVGDKQGVYRHLVGVLVSQGKWEEAFDAVERAKARALVDMLAARQQFPAERMSAEAGRLIAQLSKAEANPALQDYSLPETSRMQLRGLKNDLRSQLLAASPEIASLVTVSTMGLRDVRSRLAADETLVEYFGGEDKWFAFIVRRDGVKVFPIDGKGLHQSVENLRKQLLANPGQGDPLPAAQALYRRLILPLQPDIATERLVIVAHGPLHYLPFAVLHDGRDYLIQRHTLRMLPSASVMRFLAAKAGQGEKLLLLGNPDLKDAALDLAHAQEEAEAIARSSPKSTLLMRKAATETSVKRQGKQYDRLHFASHGIFDAAKPMHSGLLLAADTENDGRLTVDELYALSIDADLVVLSACETALGRVASGDDVVGFTRGFLFAGARSIVSSLWSVEDQSTKELMLGFYSRLGKKDKATALREAQLAMIRKYGNPFFWGAFQLTGEAR